MWAPGSFRRVFHWISTFWGDSHSRALHWGRGSPHPPPCSTMGWSPPSSLQLNDGLFGESTRGRGSVFLLVWSVSRRNSWDVDQSPFLLTRKWVAPAPMSQEPPPDEGCPILTRRASKRKMCLPPPSAQRHGVFPDQNLFINIVQQHRV